ncbi:unnamed protein product [Symbiodinium sp. CCMP2456]|nr:unnamed protein product [Symbiodinium sp. CCMP2456]
MATCCGCCQLCCPRCCPPKCDCFKCPPCHINCPQCCKCPPCCTCCKSCCKPCVGCFAACGCKFAFSEYQPGTAGRAGVKAVAGRDSYVEVKIEKVYMVDPVPCWRVTLMSADPLHSHPMARVAIKNKSLVDQKTPWVYVIDLSLENSGQEVFNLVASLRAAPTRQRLSLEHLPEEVTYTDAPVVFQSVVPQNARVNPLASTWQSSAVAFGGFGKHDAAEGEEGTDADATTADEEGAEGEEGKKRPDGPDEDSPAESKV